MGCAHPTGELSCKDVGPTTPEFPCQPTFPHSQVQSVTSSNGTNPPNFTPSFFQQLFSAYPEYLSRPKPQNYTHVTLGPPPASPADPIRFSSSHESHWSSVAHWETNGTAISSADRTEVKPNPYSNIDYAFVEALVSSAIKAEEEEAALAMPPIPLSPTPVPELSESAPVPSSTTDLNQTVPDQWQIALESSPIVLNTFDIPETDDSLPMPSSIPRDSLALLFYAPYLPLSLSELRTDASRARNQRARLINASFNIISTKRHFCPKYESPSTCHYESFQV